MKMRISPSGDLQIFRKHGFKTQTCVNEQFKSCGDHCPMFGEPFNNYNVNGEVWYIFIKICQGRELTSLEKEFEDLRVVQESEYDYDIKID